VKTFFGFYGIGKKNTQSKLLIMLDMLRC